MLKFLAMNIKGLLLDASVVLMSFRNEIKAYGAFRYMTSSSRTNYDEAVYLDVVPIYLKALLVLETDCAVGEGHSEEGELQLVLESNDRSLPPREELFQAVFALIVFQLLIPCTQESFDLLLEKRARRVLEKSVHNDFARKKLILEILDASADFLLPFQVTEDVAFLVSALSNFIKLDMLKSDVFSILNKVGRRTTEVDIILDAIALFEEEIAHLSAEGSTVRKDQETTLTLIRFYTPTVLHLIDRLAAVDGEQATPEQIQRGEEMISYFLQTLIALVIKSSVQTRQVELYNYFSDCLSRLSKLKSTALIPGCLADCGLFAIDEANSGLLNETQSFVATLLTVKCAQPCLSFVDDEGVKLLLQLTSDHIGQLPNGLSSFFAWLRNDWVASKEADYQIIAWGFSRVVHFLRQAEGALSQAARDASIEFLKLLAVFFVNAKAGGIDTEALCNTIRILILFRRPAALADARALSEQVLKIVCTQVDAGTLRTCIQDLEASAVEELKTFITTHVVAPQSTQGEAGGYAGNVESSRGGSKLKIRKAN